MVEDDTDVMFVGEVPKPPSIKDEDDMTPFYIRQWEESRRNPIKETLVEYTLSEEELPKQEHPETIAAPPPSAPSKQDTAYMKLLEDFRNCLRS